MPIVAPLHTYVRDAIKALGITAPNLHIMPTQSYLSFGYLMNQAKAIVTDSGNVAEEATFLGIPFASRSIRLPNIRRPGEQALMNWSVKTRPHWEPVWTN